MDGDIFTIEARKCKRCGRLLFSKEALKRGYGCLCERKAMADGTYGREADREDDTPMPGQVTIFDILETEREVGN